MSMPRRSEVREDRLGLEHFRFRVDAGATRLKRIPLNRKVPCGSEQHPDAQIFLFWSTRKFSTRRRAIPLEISLRNVKGHETGARNELITGNGLCFCRAVTGI